MTYKDERQCHCGLTVFCLNIQDLFYIELREMEVTEEATKLELCHFPISSPDQTKGYLKTSSLNRLQINRLKNIRAIDKIVLHTFQAFIVFNL